MFIVGLTFVGGENPKILHYNELYPPFFEKDKTMESFQRSCVQVMALGRINDKGKLLPIKQNSKTHSTLRDKTFFGVYAEELYHATTQLGWSVTCIHAHYTFRQEMFKKDFVVKNQNAREGASSEVDKNFYKLMNNSNFGFDCQNNVDKCALKLLYDGVDEVKYARTYYSDILTDYKMKEFFTTDALCQEVEERFKMAIDEIDLDEEGYDEAVESALELKEREIADILGKCQTNKKKERKTFYADSKVNTTENQVEKSMDLRKNKILIEFSNCEGASVKQIAVKRPESVKTTTRFLAGKMLMFAKLSLKSFIYQVSELLTFPNDVVQEIYAKYGTEKIYLYHILTDADSTSLQIVAISAANSQFAEPEFRNILFEVFSSTDICQRFEKLDKFWKQFDVHDQANRKVLLGVIRGGEHQRSLSGHFGRKSQGVFGILREYTRQQKAQGGKKVSCLYNNYIFLQWAAIIVFFGKTAC